jgi:hypothetical protein
MSPLTIITCHAFATKHSLALYSYLSSFLPFPFLSFPGKTCQRPMTWMWRGKYHPTSRSEYEAISRWCEYIALVTFICILCTLHTQISRSVYATSLYQ